MMLRYMIAAKARTVLLQSEESISFADDLKTLWGRNCERKILSRWALTSAEEFRARRWVEGRSDTPYIPIGHVIPNKDINTSRQINATSPFQLRYYAQQLAFLVGDGVLSSHPYLQHAARLNSIANELVALKGESVYSCYPLFELHRFFELPPSASRAVYHWSADGGGVGNFGFSAGAVPESSALLNGDREVWRGALDAFLHPRPGGRLAVVDHALHEAALRDLFSWLARSTHWWDARFGYLGTYLDWWAHPTVLRLADELQEALPGVLGGLALDRAWAYLYDNEGGDGGGDGGGGGEGDGSDRGVGGPGVASRGIPEHADDATVNVNLWVTPDEYNLDVGGCAGGESRDCGGSFDGGDGGGGDGGGAGRMGKKGGGGGLIVFTKPPPIGWTPHEFNQRPDLVRQFLGDAPENVTIPYRQNRMVIFDSRLFHRTDDHHFTKRGALSRRINLTLLFK
jgi:hypothetical protein